MSRIDYQVLRAKAEKATYGEWSLEYGDGQSDGDDALIHRGTAGYIPVCKIEGARPESGSNEDFQIEWQVNAEFIAATDPAAVLTLLGERERNQQYIKHRDQESEGVTLTVRKLRVELEAVEKQISKLEARGVVLSSTQDVHPLGPQSAEVFCEFHRNIISRCADEIRKAGINVSIEGKQEYSWVYERAHYRRA